MRYSSRLAGVLERLLNALPGRPSSGGWLAALRLSPLLWAIGLPAPARAQASLTVAPGFDPNQWLAPDAALTLRLSQPLASEDGRIAVMVGPLDLSALFTAGDDGLTLDRGRVRLPSGEHDLVVYVVGADEAWQEIGRMRVRILTRAGFEQGQVTPRITLSNKGQIVEGHAPEASRPPRPEFQDFGLNLGMQSEHVRRGWTIHTQSNFVGVTNREESLRFAQEADRAPRFDLSDYQIQVQHGRTTVSLGNVSYGNQRHIIAGWEARGLGLIVPLGSFAALSLAGLSGSTLVGWSNPLGLGRPSHRLFGGTLGFEIVPRRPGALQVQFSLFNGRVQPQASFGQGAIIEPEASRSAGVRVVASDPSQRLRFEGGFARTRFTNPFDPTLAQGATLVPVAPTTRSARYLDLRFELVRGLRVSPAFPFTLALTARHERVDPLYRSVASPQSRADLLQNGLQMDLSLGAVSAQLVHTQGHDNLDRISTILTTLTRSTTVNLALPLNQLFGAQPRIWLPMITYGLARIHQFGDSVPTLGGFTPTFVPDQASTNHTLGLVWQAPQWRVLYQLNRSGQDNRQQGREAADFVNQIHVVSLGFTPLRSLDVGLDAGFERAENREFSQRHSTRRVGSLVTWRFTSRNALVGNISRTRITEDPGTALQSATDLRLELSQRIALVRGRSDRPPAQLFVRYAHQLGDRVVPPSGRDPRRNWSVNTGVTLSLF